MTDRADKILIVHADDLGLQHCFNAGILKAAQKGFLTSACLRANGLALRAAIEEVLPQTPDLGLGVHICLNEGAALAPAAKSSQLSGGPDNSFRHTGLKGFLRLWFLGHSAALRQQVEVEMRAQIEAIAQKVSIDHLNGHMHIHAIPWIFQIALALAEEYGIPYIRLPKEPFQLKSLSFHRPSIPSFGHYLNMCRWLPRLEKLQKASRVQANDYFFGLLHSSFMSAEVSRALLAAAELRGVIEILYHPAMPANDTKYITGYMKDFCESPGRDTELEALTSADLKNSIEKLNYSLSNYRVLAGGNT